MDVELSYPNELKYTKTHEWVKVNGQTALMGISDHAQYKLGDIVYVELPTIGSTFDKGDVLGEIESVKAISEFFLPLTGEILEVNEKLQSNPEYVNESPYDKGWFLRIKFSNSEEIEDLLNAEQYIEFIKAEDE